MNRASQWLKKSFRFQNISYKATARVPEHRQIRPAPSHHYIISKQPKQRKELIFKYSFATYAHHDSRDVPRISSLSDLSDATNLGIAPKRRIPGEIADTFSVRNGDDALLVSPSLIGVADGVSAWSGKCDDAGKWARHMLETVSRKIVNLKLKASPNMLHPKEIEQCLDDSFLHTTNLMEISHLKGSSTIMLGMIIADKLKIISIGDSKIYIIRDGELIATNKEQMISPLCPNQIGTHLMNQMPSSIAWMKMLDIKKGDVIIMASDGLSDNLWETEIVSYVNEKLKVKDSSLQEVANYLLYKAKDVAFDNFAACPYIERLNAMPSKSSSFVVGGKMDDISICVARVSESS